MPFSETRKTRKVDANQSKMIDCSSDLSSFTPENGFIELLWENGQIVMHGQSNSPRRSLPTTSTTSNTSSSCTIGAQVQLKAMDSLVNDFSPSEASGNVGLNAQDDDMVPWINHSIKDSLHNDYLLEYMSEFPGVNLNSVSTHNKTVLTDMEHGSSHNMEHGNTSKALAGGSDPSRILFQTPQQCLSLVSSIKSRVTDGGSSSTHPGLAGDLLSSRKQKQDPASARLQRSSCSTGLMNFSHFLRPVAPERAHLQSVDRLRSDEKAPTSTRSNPMVSKVIDPTSGLESSSATQGRLASPAPKLEQRSSTKPPQEMLSVGQSDANLNDSVNNDNSILPDCINHQSSNLAASTMPSGRNFEAKNSCVCLVNSSGAASNDPKHIKERKTQQEESGSHSEDPEDESVGLKKPATVRGTSTKRSRSAAVHNLSERRRRDRINEKMRALQELIPNCNKVDKASMLDEAIEYLKTLQLQVQIMSMGSGLCMSPMILPSGMQHVPRPPMALLSQMGVGMGVGTKLGYGMGMLDMNGSASCPLVPVPPTQGPQFPFTSIPGTQVLHGMQTSTSLPMFGIPGQGLPASMLLIPPLCSLSGLSARPNSMPEPSGTRNDQLLATGTVPSSSAKVQQQQRLNLEATQKTLRNGKISMHKDSLK